MTVRVAKSAGFCFGVKRATDFIEKTLSEGGARVYTLGAVIHNRIYNESLAARGVVTAELSDARRIAEASDTLGKTVMVVRAHGIERAAMAELRSLEAEHSNFTVADMTCPFVARLSELAAANSGEGRLFIIIGAADHPEVRGVVSYVGGEYRVFPDESALAAFTANETDKDRAVVLAAQTTQKISEWKKCKENIQKVYTNPQIFDTICGATETRQQEVEQLAKTCDTVIVIGGRDSSNTGKLYGIAKQYCANTRWIESAAELPSGVSVNSPVIGIAAGASTPRGIIEEVVSKMNNEQFGENFEQMLEASLKTLNTGDTVHGVITSVSPGEVHLDIGAKVTGIIPRDQITDDPSAKLEEMFKPGDEIDAFVIKVSDVEGMATLSKKRIDLIKNWKNIVQAYNDATVLEGKIVEVVRGGVLILLDGVKVFIPSRFSGLPRDADLNTLLGTTAKVKIIDIDEHRRHAYASIRAVSGEIRRAQKEEFWNEIEVGKHYRGTVKSMTTYGAFVDLGGVDGMVHNTELSWKRIKHPSEVVSLGQEIEVYVKEFDKERGRISLGYKTDDMNMWNKFYAEYKVGDIVNVKVVSMMPFGAFAEVIDGVDGLIHISQISHTRIAKPGDVLKVGETVDVKITDIDAEKQKISLSITAIEDDARRAEEEAARAEQEQYIVESAEAATATEETKID